MQLIFMLKSFLDLGIAYWIKSNRFLKCEQEFKLLFKANLLKLIFVPLES